MEHIDHEEDEVYEYPKAGAGPVFASIENILRCAICREVSVPPVSLPCCQQVFCSLCIRQSLDSIAPRCPICRGNAAQNQLVVSKELRSLCNIWKNHRREIVDTVAAGCRGGTANEVAAQPPSGRRRLHKRTAGEGRDGGRLRGVHYHSVKDGKMRELLRSLGLPSHGDKATMVARHKRLVLLDAASNDRETPLPRPELIRQVLSWEREKERERAATAAAARTAARAASSAVAVPEEQRLADGSEDSAHRVEIPKKMQDGFKALIEKARQLKAARKRKNSDADGEESTDGHKRAKNSRDANDGQDSIPHGERVPVGTFDATPPSSMGFSESASTTPALGTRPLTDTGRTSNVGGASRHEGVENQDAFRILGVAGKMVPTNGPWRCLFARAVGSVNRRKQAPLASIAENEASADATLALDSAPDGSTRSADEVNHGSEEGGALVGATREAAEAAASEAEAQAAGGTGDTPSAADKEFTASLDDGVEGSLLREEGLIYLNTTTREAVREPPSELVAQCQEAEAAGGYLVFVPSRAFVSVNTTPDPASVAGTSQLASSSEPKLLADENSSTGGIPKHGGEAQAAGAMERGQGSEELPALEQTPRSTLRASNLRQDGGSGAWDRLSCATQASTPASASGALADEDIVSVAKPSPDGQSQGDGADSAFTIDLSQGNSQPGRAQSGSVRGGSARDAESDAQQGSWTCAACTLQNERNARECEVCRAPKPRPSGSKRRPGLRMLSRRSSDDVAPQSSITSFTSRSEAGGDSGSGVLTRRSLPVSEPNPTAAPVTRMASTTVGLAGFPTVRSPERSALVTSPADLTADKPQRRLEDGKL